ncbi:MAG: ion transporter [Bacteroidales bacterium]|nr:ion transporter [Bacteroidales bacterium]
MKKIKLELARVFDDNLHTKQWHNWVDYTIIGLIIVSTVEVFLSTFDGIAQRYGAWLQAVDIFTTVFFTIEVSLRIWCADLIDPKYKGFWGRVRYCLSFYGLIDFLSTYTFYIAFLVPIPYVLLKGLRIARLMRVFRYMKAFRLLSAAISSKKRELWVSLQFLGIVTLILSFILFFVEHAVQPEVYDNGWTSVAWAFAQYIGDPGGFADQPPITLAGQIIACIVGLLGIAIFAVPAGLVGSAFSDVMDDEKKAQEHKEFALAINEMMLVKSIKREGLFWPAKNISFGDLKLNLSLTEEEVLKSVDASNNLRIKNLASAVLDGPKNDMMVVNQFFVNEEYGSHIERGSSVTIVNPLGVGDNGLSFFDWHIAQLGGFNYVANEKFSRQISDRSKRYNFYSVDDETEGNSTFQSFVNDIVAKRGKGDWIVVIAGEQIVKNKTHLHFEFGGEKGEERFDFEGGIAPDREMVKILFDDMQKTMEQKAGLVVDAHKVQPKLAPQNIARYLQARTEANVLLLTVSYKLMVFYNEVHSAIVNIAEVLNRNLENMKPHELHKEEYTVRPINSDYWKKLYFVTED